MAGRGRRWVITKDRLRNCPSRKRTAKLLAAHIREQADIIQRLWQRARAEEQERGASTR